MWSASSAAHSSDAVTILRHGSDVNLDIDATAFVQIGLFVVLFLMLKPMLFDPMLKLFEEREKRIEGNISKARKIDEESAKAKAEYEDVLNDARRSGSAEREKIKNEGLKQEADLLANVRRETALVAEDNRKKAEKDLAVAREQLGKDSAALAGQLAGIVLGREVRG